MNAIKNKIRSESGASITFALLLFLVCAVISSVVIVAGSTAAGRMRGLKDMDARYGVIADAGHQLCRIFDGQEVAVTYRKADMSVPTQPTGNAILVDASRAVVTGGTLSTSPVTASITDGDTDYACSLSETLEGGVLEFTISADGGKFTNGAYSVRLTFAPNVKKAASDAASETATATVTWKLRDIRKLRATTTP